MVYVLCGILPCSKLNYLRLWLVLIDHVNPASSDNEWVFCLLTKRSQEEAKISEGSGLLSPVANEQSQELVLPFI